MFGNKKLGMTRGGFGLRYLIAVGVQPIGRASPTTSGTLKLLYGIAPFAAPPKCKQSVIHVRVK